MSYLNMTQLIGNTGGEPEIRYTPTGLATARVRVATTEMWKDRDSGERKERTEWHQVVFYGRLAEVAGEYVGKGDKIYIQGHLRTRKWADKDGVDRYTTEVVCEEMKMFPKRKANSDHDDGSSESAPTGATRDTEFDDDIPF